MKATYKGPGDGVELDGLEVKKGQGIELTTEQVARIRAGGGEVDVAGSFAETTDDRDKILAAQGKTREKAARDRERETERAAKERAEADLKAAGKEAAR